MSLNDFIKELEDKHIQVTVKDNKLSIKAPSGAMTSNLKMQFHAYKEQLIALLGKTENMDASKQSIIPVSRDERLPLSYSQQRLWLMDQIEKESDHYLIPGVLDIKGELNFDHLEGAFIQVLDRHERLRTSFDTD
jgi:hypothetical protein